MLKKVILLSFFLLFLYASIHAETMDEEEIIEGSFIKVENEVKVKRGTEEEFPATVGLELYGGDLITTGKDSMAEISLKDGSTLRISPNSKVIINISDATEDESSGISVILGRIWGKVKKKVEDAITFKVQTPSSVCGVRGTEFDVIVGPDGATRIGVVEGFIWVEGDESQEEDLEEEGFGVDLPSGRCVEVYPDSSPTKAYECEIKDEDYDVWVRRGESALEKDMERLARFYSEGAKNDYDYLEDLRMNLALLEARAEILEKALESAVNVNYPSVEEECKELLDETWSLIYATMDEIQWIKNRIMMRVYLIDEYEVFIERYPLRYKVYLPVIRPIFVKVKVWRPHFFTIKIALHKRFIHRLHHIRYIRRHYKMPPRKPHYIRYPKGKIKRMIHRKIRHRYLHHRREVYRKRMERYKRREAYKKGRRIHKLKKKIHRKKRKSIKSSDSGRGSSRGRGITSGGMYRDRKVKSGRSRYKSERAGRDKRKISTSKKKRTSENKKKKKKKKKRNND